MELGTIKQINIDSEMQASYLDYAMSVIVARALPDVRDGLKPVHRRILYAMHDLGLRPDQPYKKSARIVGEVLGKYHPHGDAAVYEAMVRMAQDFSLRYPLVDGQGNFGSIDGDNAAAMRYTEARLAKIAMEMLNDIEKDTVDWGDNFDGTLKEPLVLPAALPNLIVNGSSGIAVGMSTNIPPHNLGEVCDALCHLIDNFDRRDEVTIEDIMKYIPGPDFPTGGVIFRYGAPGEDGEREDAIAKAYANGRGHITVQAKAHIEEMSRNRSRIVVTELPYGSNKSSIIERIAELAREGRLEGLTDLRDESDRTGMRLCIEMTRTVEPRDVLAMLYKLTPLQQTFGISLLALVDGEPRTLGLKRMLLHFIEHRQEVIVRRAKHDLAKAKARAHILEGLLKALDILDEVIALIRGSRTADVARQGLMKQFGFSELQAQAILDMQLRRLAALERKKLQDEYRDILALIKELEELLRSPKKVLALIRQNLVDLKATYGDARRTQITDQARGALTVTDVIPDEETWVTVRADGTVGRAAGRLPAGSAAPQFVLSANTHCDLYLISRRGQATRISVHQLPDGAGNPHWDLGGLKRGDKIAAAFTARKPNGEPLEGYVVLATAQGAIKRVNLADLASAAQGNPQVIKLDADDDLVWAGTSNGGGEIMLVTAGGQAIRFVEDEARAMGLPAGGIAGIKLQANDRVVGGAVLNAENARHELATVTAGGFGRRSPLNEFPTKGRGTQGVAAKLSTKSGEIASAFLVKPEDKLMLVTASDQIKPLAAKALPSASRTNAGKAVAVLAAGEQVARAVLLPPNGVEPEPPAKRGNGAQATATRARKAEGEPPVAAKETPKPRASKAAAPAATSPTEPAAPTASASKAPRKTKEATPVVEAKTQAPTVEEDEVVVRRGKPAAMSAQQPPEEVVSRRGQPASMARPGGDAEGTTPAKAARSKAPAAESGQMLLVPEEPATKPKTTPRTKVQPAPAKATPAKGAAAKPAAAAGAKPETKATSQAAAAKTPAAKGTPAAKEPAKPAAAKTKRVLEAEFKPKPKSEESKPPKADAPDGLQTTWSPSPPRTPEEPSSKPPKGKGK